MKITIEDNRESIKRYGHIKRGPMGSPLCSARCPGSVRSCTLGRNHSGPHVAHGTFARVVAVWDRDHPTQVKPVKPRKPPVRKRSRDGGILTALKALGRRLIPSDHFIEASILLFLALAMVGFAIDWALRILGLR